MYIMSDPRYLGVSSVHNTQAYGPRDYKFGYYDLITRTTQYLGVNLGVKAQAQFQEEWTLSTQTQGTNTKMAQPWL